MDGMEERAEKKAREWAAMLKKAHEDTNGEWIVFDEGTLAHLIKKCLMTTV